MKNLKEKEITKEEKYKEAVEDLIAYAVDEGLLSEEAFEWDFDEKARYYEYCMAYDPDEPEEE